MSTENVTWTADVQGYIRNIAAIQAKEKELRRDTKATALAVTQGSKDAINAYMQQMGMLQQLSLEKKKLNQQISFATSGTQQFGRSMGQTNMIIQQGVFAVDDFLTVVGQQGLAGGLRAAGNNLSLILSMFNPWLALVPAAATAIATFALKTDDSKKSTEKATDALQEYGKVLKDIIAEIEKANLSPEQIQQKAEREAVANVQEQLQKKLDPVQEQIAAKEKRKAELNKIIATSQSPHTRIAARRELDKINEVDLPPLEIERNQIQYRQGKIRDKQAELEMSRIEKKNREEIDNQIREAVMKSIGDAESEMNADQTRPRFGLIQRDIAKQEKATKHAQQEYEDANINVRRPGSERGREVSPKEQEQLDALRDVKETNERMLEVLREMHKDSKEQFNRDIMLNRAGQDAA